jgi:hypothetical protein
VAVFWSSEFYPLRFGFLSRRDLRTQPGVLTPGRNKKDTHPEGVADWIFRDDLTGKRNWGRRFCHPFRAGLDMGGFPGLKPRAQSCYPFGIKRTNLSHGREIFNHARRP